MSRRRKGEEKFCNKTLESYKHVLDSMVNFLGASGALIRQRIETGQMTSDIDCEVECLACSPQRGVMCQECLKQPLQSQGQIPLKECAAGKTVTSQLTQDSAATATDNQEVQGAVEKPAEIVTGPIPPGSNNPQVTTAGPSDNDSSVCVCAQVRKIKESASKVGVQTSDSKSR